MGLEPYHCQKSVEKYCCRNCDYTTDVTTELNHHFSKFHGKLQSEVGSHRVSRSYPCEKCCFQSYSVLCWLKHVSSNHSDETQWFTCDKSELRQHKSEHIIKWYECDQCDYKTDKNFALRRHKLTHWYKCEKCPYVVKKKSQLEGHILNSHSKWLECNKCNFRTKQDIVLKLHWDTKHAKERKFSTDCSRLITMYKCPRCPYLVGNKRQLEAHRNTAHLLEKICSNKYNIRAYENYSPNYKWFKCGKCERYTSREVFLVPCEPHGVGSRAKYRRCEHCSYTSPIRKVGGTRKYVGHKRKYKEKYLDHKGIHLIDHNYCRQECT